MFAFAQRVFQLLLTILRPWTASVWPYISRLLDGDAPAAYINKHISHEAQSSSAEVQNPPQATPSQYPSRIRYVPIPGEWERKLHPGWPESTFRVPDHAPEGYIYYIRKGDYVRRGATALVERLPTGHITKTPLPNPYDPDREQRVCQNMEHEYTVYRHIGSSPFIPELIDWDSKSIILVLAKLSCLITPLPVEAANGAKMSPFGWR